MCHGHIISLFFKLLRNWRLISTTIRCGQNNLQQFKADKETGSSQDIFQ